MKIFPVFLVKYGIIFFYIVFGKTYSFFFKCRCIIGKVLMNWFRELILSMHENNLSLIFFKQRHKWFFLLIFIFNFFLFFENFTLENDFISYFIYYKNILLENFMLQRILLESNFKNYNLALFKVRVLTLENIIRLQILKVWSILFN